MVLARERDRERERERERYKRVSETEKSDKPMSSLKATKSSSTAKFCKKLIMESGAERLPLIGVL